MRISMTTTAALFLCAALLTFAARAQTAQPAPTKSGASSATKPASAAPATAKPASAAPTAAKPVGMAAPASSAGVANPKPAPAPARPAPAPASSAAARTAKDPRGALLLAPKIGLFEPTSSLRGAAYLAFEVGYATPLLDHGLVIALEVDWYRPKGSGSVANPALTVNGQTASGAYNLGLAEFGVLLSAIYRAEDAFIPGLTPYGGLGPGVYSHRSAITAFGQMNLEKETKLGFQLLGGADYRLGPGAIFGEVRYHFARVDLLSTGNANVGGFLALGAGYRLRFF